MIHNTHFSQFIPCTSFHVSTATITQVAGDVAGTIAINRAAANQTSVITIPITIPSNSVALQGSKLVSIEVDYEVKAAEPTSLTWTLNKVTRGIDGAVAVWQPSPRPIRLPMLQPSGRSAQAGDHDHHARLG